MLFAFLLVLLGFLDLAGEFVRIPPGLGRPEMWLSDELVCKLEVFGS